MSRRPARLLAALALLIACGAERRGTMPPPDGGAPSVSPEAGAPVVDASEPDVSTPEAAAPDAPPVGAFPPAFLFGTATSGFQVEMGCPTIAEPTCEDQGSDWYQWITTQRILDNKILFMSGDPPSKGPGFFELYEKDLDRAANEMRNGALRLSIEWSRIFPQPTFGVTGHAALKAIASADGIAFYHRLFDAMKKRYMRPLVTVNHYSLPLWIHDGNQCNQSLSDCIAAKKGGWADPDRTRIVDEMAKYAGFLAEEYGGEVDRWATLNEPFSAVVIAGYLVSSPDRSNPPGLSGPWASKSGAQTAALAMIEAHARMYDAIHAGDTADADGDGEAVSVGIVYPFTQIEPASSSQDDAKAADDAKYFFQDMFMDGVVFGKVDETWDKGRGNAPVRADIAGRVDFIGVNYYFRFHAKSATVPLSVVSPFVDFDPLAQFEPDRPQDIYPVLHDVFARYGKPIYITETGTTMDDETRGAAWIVRALAETRRAIHDGVDVRGFFIWTLTDNYEWNHGMNVRMGLYAMDPASKTRKAREAARAYGEACLARDVPASLQAKYASYFQ